jgi:hypothetical protein
MLLSKETLYFKNGDLAQWARVLLGGVAIGHGFKTQSDQELFLAKNIAH